MEAVLFYFGKVILTSGVMFLYYQLFLKDKTFHHYNRFYLLAVMLVSLFLPLLKVSYFTIEVNNDIYLLINKFKNTNTKTDHYDFSYFRIFTVGFGLVSVFLLSRFIFGILKISTFKNRFPKEEFEGINFYQTDLNNAPFSYFRNLFWKNSILINSDLGRQILKHEMVHIEQKHTFDKIFIEVIKSIFWFNPFFYLIKKEIHLIHEYLADKKAVKQSDTKAFAQMLLASHFSGKMIPATSPFLSSNLKKRLTMLKKPKTKFSYARRIFAMPLIFALAFTYLVNAKNREIKATNIEIAKAVNEIKFDTIQPKKEATPSKEEISKAADEVAKKLNKNDRDIAEIGKKIQEKSSELKTLPPDSKEFADKVDEINVLSGKISDIANSDDFKNNVTAFSFNVENWDQEKINEVMKKAQEKLNSKEFKIQMAKNKEFFNSDEWKQQVKGIEKIKFDFNDVAFGEDGTELFKKHPEIFFKSDLEKIKKDVERGKISAKEAKKLEKIAKEKQELSKKQAELAKKAAQLTAEQRKISGKDYTTMYISRNSFPKSYTFSNDNFLKKNLSEDVTVYIDGKLSTQEEMSKISPDSIESININKNSNNGKEKSEIKIRTKK